MVNFMARWIVPPIRGLRVGASHRAVVGLVHTMDACPVAWPLSSAGSSVIAGAPPISVLNTPPRVPRWLSSWPKPPIPHAAHRRTWPRRPFAPPPPPAPKRRSGCTHWSAPQCISSLCAGRRRLCTPTDRGRMGRGLRGWPRTLGSGVSLLVRPGRSSLRRGGADHHTGGSARRAKLDRVATPRPASSLRMPPALRRAGRPYGLNPGTACLYKRAGASSWLRTELRQKGWRYLS